MGRAFDLLQDRLGIVNTSGVRKNSRDQLDFTYPSLLLE